MSDILQQDLSQEAEFSHMFMIELLFEERPALIDRDALEKAAREKFGEIETVMSGDEMISFAVKKYTAHFKEGDIPPMAVLAQGLEFDSSSVSEFDRYQLWDVRDGGELLDKCRFKCFVSEMMSAVMDYKDRCEMMMDWLECVLPLMPECTAVWVPSAGKLMLPEAVLGNNIPREQRFVHRCVNARFFNIDGTDGDMIVDTLGMYAVGLPDVQLHFNGLEPDAVVDYAYNICLYNYDENAPIESGETIDGIGEDGRISMDVQWTCQYEDALIQPVRTVLDINPAEFAAGKR